MNIEAALRMHLVNHSGLAALVAGRIYPLLLPQSPTLPAVTYQKISSIEEYAQDGSSSLRRVRFQIDCWAGSYASAKAVAAQVKAALIRFCGLLGGAGGVQVGGVWLDDETDFYESDPPVFRVSVDIRLIY
ncbi:MAG: tail completion protein gp17 [Betaproteobacteria bacterium]